MDTKDNHCGKEYKNLFNGKESRKGEEWAYVCNAATERPKGDVDRAHTKIICNFPSQMSEYASGCNKMNLHSPLVNTITNLCFDASMLSMHLLASSISLRVPCPSAQRSPSPTPKKQADVFHPTRP
ncbi:hypothetical protein Tco_0377491 [Tanacetum coccineum]